MSIFRWIILLCMPSISLANVQGDLQNFFNNMGYGANVSDIGAYQDQSGGYFTGGSLVTRAKADNTTLLSLQMPSLRAGCGGIDLFMGGLSYINSESFIQMVKSIGNNTMSFGFGLALQTVSPQIKSVLDQLSAVAQDVNNTNINSCQAAATIVGGAWPKTEASSQMLCSAMGTSQNRFTDYAQARQGCGAGGLRDDINKNKTEEFKDMLGDEFNLVWKALQKNSLFTHDRELAELFMTLSGTLIATKQISGGKTRIHPHYVSALINDDSLLNVLVEGGKAMIYQCDSYEEDKCLHPVKKSVLISKQHSFLSKVTGLLDSLSNKIVTDTPSNQEEKGLVNATNIPILKILSVQLAFKSDNNPIAINELAEVIAYDILLRYLNRVIDTVSDSLYTLQKVQIGNDDIQIFHTNLKTAKTIIYQKRQGLYQQLNTSLAIVERTQQIEQQLFQLFTEQVM